MKTKWIPIDQLNEFRATLKNNGIKFRVRFRGPRPQRARFNGVPCDTLKENATHFVVYYFN